MAKLCRFFNKKVAVEMAGKLRHAETRHVQALAAICTGPQHQRVFDHPREKEEQPVLPGMADEPAETE